MRGKIGEYVLITGKLIKDAEYRTVGQNRIEQTRFAVSTGKDDPLVSCTAWRTMAKSCAELKKGARVFVTGTISKREYNGKTYEDLTVDFLARQFGDGEEKNVSNAFDSFTNVAVPDDLF